MPRYLLPILLTITAFDVAALGVTIDKKPYHEWADAISMTNGVATVVVVPSIGRVMAFGLNGKVETPFWNNRTLDGKPVVAGKEWINFGGDKSWPAPQSEWQKIVAPTQGGSWPPPWGFDASVNVATIKGEQIELLSPVDISFGIRVRRLITLDKTKAEMTIQTTYEKMTGDPRRVAVWTITQLQSPKEATATIASGTWKKQSDAPPHNLQNKPNLVSIDRDPAKSVKIGTNGNILTWRGDVTLEIEVLQQPNEPNSVWPDEGCKIEIYTNPDPLPYVELETLGPLHTLKVGDRISATNRYRLRP